MSKHNANRRMERNETTEPWASVSIWCNFDRQFGLLGAETHETGEPDAMCAHIQVASIAWNSKAKKT
jgi:hypothetical protein